MTGHQVELGDRGLYVIRCPDGTLYNGGWYAKRIAGYACESLNAVGVVKAGQKPDKLLREVEAV